jgi:hypothetical protein
MNDGIKILLERLKTHPEEFTDDENPFTYEGKWMRIFDKYKHNLSKEDVDTFLEAFNNLRQEKFTAEVMAELLNPKQEEQLTLNPYQIANVTHGAGQTLRVSSGAGNVNTVGGTWGTSPYATSAQINANSLTLGTATLTDTKLHELLHMKAQMELEKQKKKEHKTLFGKLFNYL